MSQNFGSPAPAASTPPSGGAGMFLDDGREIKTKLIAFTVSYSQHHYENHSITQPIIGATCLIDGFTPNHGSDKYDFTFTATANDIGIQLKAADSELRGGKAKVLITYLV